MRRFKTQILTFILMIQQKLFSLMCHPLQNEIAVAENKHDFQALSGTVRHCQAPSKALSAQKGCTSPSCFLIKNYYHKVGVS